jgi:hypothetical protein
MAIGSVPPRANVPLATSVEAQKAEAAPGEPKKKIDKDELQKGALPKPAGALGQAGLPAPPKGDFADVSAHIEAFTTLGGQVGDVPEGVRIAGALELNLSALEQRPGIASLGFDKTQIAATTDLLALIRDGMLEVPRDIEQALNDKQALMFAPLPQAALSEQLKKLGPNEQEAFLKLAEQLGSAFASLSKKQGGVKQDAARKLRLEALKKKKGLRLSSLLDLEDIEPEELRDLLRRAKHGSSEEEAEEPEASEQAPPKSKAERTLDREALLERELQAIASMRQVVLPDLDLVALERAFASSMPSLKGLDADTLADMLLVQAGAESEQNLGTLLDEAKHLDEVGRGLKKKLTQQEQLHGEARSELRRRYEDRCRLDTAHPSRIDARAVSFDAYCEEQKLWLAAGDPNVPEAVKVVLRLSPKEAFVAAARLDIAELSLREVQAFAQRTHNKMEETHASRDALSARLEFYLERRASFSSMLRAMIAHAGAKA